MFHSTSHRGLTLHNGRNSMVAFATSSASTLTTVTRQNGSVSQLEPAAALELLNELTSASPPFNYMV